MGNIARFTVDAPWARLDHFLVARLEGLSRTRIQHLIKTGLVQVDGETVRKVREPLSGGERIQVDQSFPEEIDHLEPEDIPLNIIYEDDQIIVLDKPAGLVTHPGSGVRRGTLVNGLIGRYRHLSERNSRLRPGIVHRLDKGTSGVMVVARTDAAHLSLARQFERRKVQKTYLALVWGSPPDIGTVDANLVRDPNNRVVFKTSKVQGRPSVTAYKAVERFHGFTLLEVRPRTGRTHQIRVHLAYLGYPIFGDAQYRGTRAPANIAPELQELAGRLGQVIKRQALHALGLVFTHPVSDERMTFQAPLPDDFRAALELLRREARA